jgi:hypothetical protein
MEYVIDKNKVTVNGKTMDFPFEIGEAFLIKNMLVVRIEIVRPDRAYTKAA